MLACTYLCAFFWHFWLELKTQGKTGFSLLADSEPHTPTNTPHSLVLPSTPPRTRGGEGGLMHEGVQLLTSRKCLCLLSRLPLMEMHEAVLERFVDFFFLVHFFLPVNISVLRLQLMEMHEVIVEGCIIHFLEFMLSFFTFHEAVLEQLVWDLRVETSGRRRWWSLKAHFVCNYIKYICWLNLHQTTSYGKYSKYICCFILH